MTAAVKQAMSAGRFLAVRVCFFLTSSIVSEGSLLPTLELLLFCPFMTESVDLAFGAVSCVSLSTQ
jgi:hypothetical protein